MPKLVSVSQTVAIEQAQVNLGVTMRQLMLNAGAGVAEIIRRTSESAVGNKKVISLVGKGNNGGDALVALRDLAFEGWHGTALIFGQRSTSDSLLKAVRGLGCEVVYFSDSETETLEKIFSGEPAVIDGILGTGFRLPLSEELASAMNWINAEVKRQNCQVFSVDCPSGVNCDTGECANEAMDADVTVCMAAVKKGLLTFPAAAKTGKIETVDIGITEDNPEWQNVTDFVADEAMLKSLLPPRPLNSHKGMFGKIMVCGGCLEYPGAPILNGCGAYAVGAGLVRVASTEYSMQGYSGRLIEAVWLRLPHTNGYLNIDGIPLLERTLMEQDVLIFGSGLGINSTTTEFVNSFFDLVQRRKNILSRLKIVLDADGLRMITSLNRWYEKIPSQTVITPHPGEFRAITAGMELEGMDRLNSAKIVAEKWGCVVVLKGAMTVVAAPDGRSATIPIASPALAKAGTGDVLAGMIGGFLGQGLDVYDAAVLGAGIHAMSGEVTSTIYGNSRSIMASDIYYHTSEVFSKLEGV